MYKKDDINTYFLPIKEEIKKEVIIDIDYCLRISSDMIKKFMHPEEYSICLDDYVIAGKTYYKIMLLQKRQSQIPLCCVLADDNNICDCWNTFINKLTNFAREGRAVCASQERMRDDMTFWKQAMSEESKEK
jgi:hypothetical protein